MILQNNCTRGLHTGYETHADVFAPSIPRALNAVEGCMIFENLLSILFKAARLHLKVTHGFKTMPKSSKAQRMALN